jgi:SNF2 family DNA or RNA helicase
MIYLSHKDFRTLLARKDNSMINIRIGEPERLANNVLVKQSAFVSFDYDGQIVSYIKDMGTRVYNPSNHTWEMPITNIIGLCNKFNDREIKISGVYKNLSDEIKADIPKNFKFKTKPFNHQVDGVKFALNKGKFLLCYDQGLGKTKQIIDWTGCLSANGVKGKVLIICGVNSLKYNWLSEVRKHSNENGYVIGTRYRKNGNMYEGSLKDKLADFDNLPDCKYIITNIETIRGGAKKISKTQYSFPVAEKIQKLCDDGTISVIAFDECHKSKNPTSLQGRAMLLLHADYMCAMSGTPLMNNPLDLYFPLHWLGYENHSYYQFKTHYCNLGGFGGHEVVGYKNLDEIRALLGEIMLRRLKMEVLDLPEKIRQTEFVDMTPKQTVVYKEALNGVMANINKVEFSDNPLSMLIRLRQATGYTGIISDTIKESAKLNRMEELVEELAESGNKCIVFSNWSNITDEAVKRLAKYNPAYITGETKSEDRMVEVDRFQNDDSCKVIVGTIGAMGTGLTLTAAQTVIFLDSPWNRALKDQAEDRAHRIGTKGTVNIITICCAGTIDERIEEIVKKKGEMSDAIVDGKPGKLSKADIAYLLS